MKTTSPLSLLRAHNLNATDAKLTITRSMRKDQATITIISGEIGSGKSTLAANLYGSLTKLPKKLNVGLVDLSASNTPLSPHQGRRVPFQKVLRKLQLNFHHIIIVSERYHADDLVRLVRVCGYASTQLNIIHLG
ncbi:MAG TPA: hypothetical protein VGH19_06835 [Verrucomicrobiae bacterium]